MRNNLLARDFLKVGVLWSAFCLAFLVNGGPIYFPDSTAYFRVADAAATFAGFDETEWSGRSPVHNGSNVDQPNSVAAPAPHEGLKHATPLAGRSIYYGTALYLMGPTLAVIIQALLAAAAVLLASRRLNPNLPIVFLLGAVLLSSGPVFAALLMPDLLAALSIISVAMALTQWKILGTGEKAFWTCLMLAGVLAHSATLLIVGVLLAIVVAIARKSITATPVAVILLVGVIAEICFSIGVERATGSPPLRPPFVSARLLADGPGRTFLAATCPNEQRFIQCRFYKRLPNNSDAILWGQGGTGFISMSSDVQRVWAAEDMRFALAVFVSDPLAAIHTTAKSVARQAMGYTIDDVVMPIEREKLPPNERKGYDSTLTAQHAFPSQIWDFAGYALLAISGICLLLKRRMIPLASRIILGGVLIDIIICGALSTPHDRYLMRVAWLLPLVAASLLDMPNSTVFGFAKAPVHN